MRLFGGRGLGQPRYPVGGGGGLVPVRRVDGRLSFLLPGGAGGGWGVPGPIHSSEVPEAVLGLVAGRFVSSGHMEDALPFPEVGAVHGEAACLQGLVVRSQLHDVCCGGVGAQHAHGRDDPLIHD